MSVTSWSASQTNCKKVLGFLGGIKFCPKTVFLFSMSAGCPLRPGEKRQNKMCFNIDRTTKESEDGFSIYAQTRWLNPVTADAELWCCVKPLWSDAAEVIKFDNDGGQSQTAWLLLEVKRRTLVRLRSDTSHLSSGLGAVYSCEQRAF